MALILNIESSGKLCSVSLAERGQMLSFQESAVDHSHSSVLAPAIKTVLKKADKKIRELDAVAVSDGPGSYTGLRIGSSTAKGICNALGIPLIAVSTLQALAYALKANHPQRPHFLCIADSRMDEIYMAVYDRELAELIAPCPIKIDDIRDNDSLYKNAVRNNAAAEKLFERNKFKNVAVDKSVIFSALNMNMLSFIKFKSKDYKNLIYYEPLYLKGVYVKYGKKIPTIN